jgi:hypothetical protein
MHARLIILAILTVNLSAITTAGAERFHETTTLSAFAQARAKTLIEVGFDHLYELRFGEARRQFTEWQGTHPNDPLGDVSLAASHLFEEFYRQRVFTSEFFLDDKRLLGGIKGKPDESRKAHFNQANQRARDLAGRRLKANPRDPDALFALTLVTGMQADYAGILEKRQMESLRLIKEAGGYAKKLLAVRPDAADAWLALGAANYIIGCLPAHQRFFLWFGRVRGNKRLGMEQLRMTAEKGHYLKPYAKIFLALAAMREGLEEVARKQLSDLAAQYPANPLFSDELARLNRQGLPAKKSARGSDP